ncbi:MAG: flagellar basal body P-ring formation protein FlgA, partial [Alphaproteobacteria bacterium]|nr:flagellar basal body P-ring formation protein FlgA [Alphaproteobacteria bacterium]
APDARETVTGHYCAIERIPVLNAPLNPGDVIRAADIDYVDMRSTDVSSSMITQAANLIGRTPRFGLPAMRPVAANAVKLPQVIRKGELVTMTLDSAFISLTAKGRALDNGAVGDDIRIMNPSSKQIIDAVITGPQTVSVQSPLAAPGAM